MMKANEYFYALGSMVDLDSSSTSSEQNETLQEMTKEIYFALLTEKYDNCNFVHKIGYLSFTEDTRVRFLSLLGILSRNADYDQ